MKLKRICPACHQNLYRNRFYSDKSVYCKECSRRQARESYARHHKKPDGIRRDSQGRLIEHRGCSQRIYWHAQKIADFKRLFPVRKNEELTVIFGCSLRTIVRRARELNLEKDPEWLQGVWAESLAHMQFHNKICGIKFDRNQILQAGNPYRFGSENRTPETHEQAHIRMIKAWETRRRNQRVPCNR